MFDNIHGAMDTTLTSKPEFRSFLMRWKRKTTGFFFTHSSARASFNLNRAGAAGADPTTVHDLRLSVVRTQSVSYQSGPQVFTFQASHLCAIEIYGDLVFQRLTIELNPNEPFVGLSELSGFFRFIPDSGSST